MDLSFLAVGSAGFGIFIFMDLSFFGGISKFWNIWSIRFLR